MPETIFGFPWPIALTIIIVGALIVYYLLTRFYGNRPE